MSFWYGHGFSVSSRFVPKFSRVKRNNQVRYKQNSLVYTCDFPTKTTKILPSAR